MPILPESSFSPSNKIDSNASEGEVEVEMDTNLDPDELQMLFEVHTGKYVSIHDFEANL